MEELLQWIEYIELKNGPPYHGTIRCVMGMLSPEVLRQLYGKWQDLLNRNEGEIKKKIICIAGKTMRGNKKGEERPSHIVSAWSKEDGFCLGQKAVTKYKIKNKINSGEEDLSIHAFVVENVQYGVQNKTFMIYSQYIPIFFEGGDETCYYLL